MGKKIRRQFTLSHRVIISCKHLGAYNTTVSRMAIDINDICQSINQSTDIVGKNEREIERKMT